MGGAFLEHLENKMVELGNKDEFRRYVLDHLDIFEDLVKKPKGEFYDFMIKYSTYTIPPTEYVGKSFEIMNIIDEINEKLPESVKIINHTRHALKDNKQVLSYNLVIDFSLKLTMEQIEKLAKSRRKFGDRVRRRKSGEIAYRSFREDIYDILANTYGISFNPKKKSKYYDIEFMGSRVK